ncbi:MAG: hypothetical protein P1U74_00160 [Legionellaceae bacterium]|nr:hypothetical protein [Legionellaceae bacterium]
MSDYAQIERLLEKNLSASAVRRGTSAFRFGLIPEGISDHLPIKIEINKESPSSIKMISWNLLAAPHLYNNFMNITGTKDLLARIKDDNSYAGSVENNKLYYYFSELADFLYEQNLKGNIINITEDTINKFTSLSSHGSLLTRSKNTSDEIKKSEMVVQSRAEIANILLNPNDEKAHEYRLAIQHSVELIHHIKSQSGALHWDNRYNRLRENKSLVAELTAGDFLCLQECTDPNDIQRLLPGKRAIVHAVRVDLGDFKDLNYEMACSSEGRRKSSRDHCAIFYDDTKFELVNVEKDGIQQNPIRSALHRNKPFIVARFRNIETGEECIVGSIHHPGGDKANCLDEINQAAQSLYNEGDMPIPFYLSGDYNHTEDVFSNEDGASFQMIYPDAEYGTMAGSDYENVNRSIDAVMTSFDADNVEVSRLDCLQVSRPATTPIIVRFDKNNYYRSAVRPSLQPPVENFVSYKKGLEAIKSLGENDAEYSPRISL